MEDLPVTQTQSQQSILQSDDDENEERPWGKLIPLSNAFLPYDLYKTEISCGRATTCDIIINSDITENLCYNISRKHFTIYKNNNLPVIICDHSKNGTSINNKIIGKDKTRILDHNDKISIGMIKAYTFHLLNNDNNEFLPQILKNKYTIANFLGQGAVGEVRLAFNKLTMEKFAIKKIIKGRYSSINLLNHPLKISNEINILKSISHPFIIKPEEIIETEEYVFIVLEYINGGELNTRILSEPPLNENECKIYFKQIALAVQYLHKQGITHRDLKPENVLLSTINCNNKSIIKIVDFGLSKIMDENNFMKTICGSPYYVAPEIIDIHSCKYSQQVDIWSMGVILFFMLSRNLPFFSKNKQTLFNGILTGTIQWYQEQWINISMNAIDLIKKMLIVQPDQRITIDDILEHPWIKNVPLDYYNIEETNVDWDSFTDSGLLFESEPLPKRIKLDNEINP